MLIPYAEYQTSELPWLEKVPSHWTWLRNKNIYFEKKELVGNRKDFTLLSLTKKGIIIRDISSGKGKFPKDFDTYKIVNPGEMVFCLFDVDETPRTVGLSEYHGMITGAYDVFEVKNINPKYAYYYYLAFDNIKAYKPLYSGLRKTIPMLSFMETKVPVPTENEQNQIVRYLDWKISEMNHFIHKKKKQIKKLEELKKTIINEIVFTGTRGEKKKETEFDWIPAIPENWQLLKARYLFKEVIDTGYGNELPLLSITNKDGVILQSETGRKRRMSEDPSSYKRIKPGDLGYNLMNAFIGSLGISEYDGLISPAYSVCRPIVSICPKFYEYLFRTPQFLQEFDNRSYGIMIERNRLYFDNFKQIVIVVPPVDEQEEIVNEIEKKLEKINSIISGITNEIKLVEELRTKLISDAVTGQIDVRDVVIPDYITDEDTVDEDELEESDDDSSEEDSSEE